MSVLAALTRTVFLMPAAGCAPSSSAVVALHDTEKIAGRAYVHGHPVLLTTAPALVTIDGRSLTASRQVFNAHDRAVRTLWGLGERAGALYSISQFSDFVRLTPAGATVRMDPVSRSPQPIGNLVDMDDGMAAQLAVDDEGKPVVWGVDGAGVLAKMASPVRVSLGLSRAEDGLLHLLTCSVPPRVLCWLPGSRELLTLDNKGLRPLTTVEPVRRIAPAAMLEHPQERAIVDAMWTGSDVVAVAFMAGDGRAVVAEFTVWGRMVRELAPREPVRVFLSVEGRRIVAISRAGHLMEVAR